ncbi:MAG TPA: hypothetical protein VKT32_03785 [Chthonomonadaceae bacterium]|nr:hypothetical protein [Chthonomonadaceae bacterium]
MVGPSSSHPRFCSPQLSLSPNHRPDRAGMGRADRRLLEDLEARRRSAGRAAQGADR